MTDVERDACARFPFPPAAAPEQNSIQRSSSHVH